jgi:hypothetical protein
VQSAAAEDKLGDTGASCYNPFTSTGAPMRCAILVLAFLAITFAPRTFAKDVFGNTKWAMKVEPDEDSRKLGARPYDDTYTFKGSKFESEAMKKKGFEQTEYEENQRIGGIATFTAKAESKTEGKAEWSGQVAVTEMTGELTVTKKDGTVLKYTFKGTKKD